MESGRESTAPTTIVLVAAGHTGADAHSRVARENPFRRFHREGFNRAWIQSSAHGKKCIMDSPRAPDAGFLVNRPPKSGLVDRFPMVATRDMIPPLKLIGGDAV
jgi:hypothetical protein